MESRFALVNLPLAPIRMTDQVPSKSNSIRPSQLRCIGCDRVFEKATAEFPLRPVAAIYWRSSIPIGTRATQNDSMPLNSKSSGVNAALSIPDR